MHLTITTDSELVITVECSNDETVASIKSKIDAQVGVPESEQRLSFQGKPLRDKMTLVSVGISDGDLLFLEHVRPGQQGQSPSQELINRCNENPRLLSEIREMNPGLADAIQSNDISAVETIFGQIQRQTERQETPQMGLNPMDMESQKKIEEMIRQKNVKDNFEQALETMPEMYVDVTMLFINIEVNGFPVHAFVDTGAQMTIMTENFAERCSLTRLIDRRQSGIAFGVGQSKIVGRVHQAPLKVSNQVVPSSMVVLEQNDGPPFIFGLDNLIRHQVQPSIITAPTETKTGCHITVHDRFEVVQPDLHEHWNRSAVFKGRRNQSYRPPSIPTKYTCFRYDEKKCGGVGSAGVPSGSKEEKIQRLVALGFDRQRCIEALTQSGWNEVVAASLLFGYT